MRPPQAAGFAFGLCKDPDCDSIHIDLLDAQDRTIATAVVDVEHVPDIIKKLQDLAYAISVGEKPHGRR